MLGSKLSDMLVSSFQGMGKVTMGKVPWASMLGYMLVCSFQGMGKVTMRKVPWGPYVGFHARSVLCSWQCWQLLF